jgi:hypothetical protein
MIITSMTLGTAVVLVVGAKLAKHRYDNPHLPLAIGLGLTILIPTFLIAFVLELIVLCTWNPLIWMV